MEQLRIGLIGYGKMGRAHSQAYATVSRFFNHGVEPVLAVLCGRDRKKVGLMAARFGWQSVETDWRRLAEREDVDLVDICAPTRVHEEVALAAAQQGKHVFCEKPLALTSAGAERIYMHVDLDVHDPAVLRANLFATPGGPAPEQTDAEPTLPLPRASAARERARPEQYRRLREYVSRTRRGLPALDPFVWWGVGERMQLRRMGLMRNEEGRLVKREEGR